MSCEVLKSNSPFACKDIRDRIHELYKNVDNHGIYSWLQCPPLYTTVRVNYPKDVEEALNELQEIIHCKYAVRNNKSPKVYIHQTIKDLLVIPSPPHKNSESFLYKQVIVDVSCGSAVLRGADVFVPGVLGAPLDLKSGDNVTVYADLTGKCLKGFVKSYEGPKLLLGNGIAEYSRHDIFSSHSKISGVAIQMTETVHNCPSLGDNVLGKYMHLQNLPSVLCGHILGPKNSDLVLDMCAAPGGKTTHLASIMQNRGVIIALDKSKSRLEKLKYNILTMGYTNIHAFAFDSVKALNENASSEVWNKFTSDGIVSPPPYPAGIFDCVLLDAPCSALGQRPQLSNKMTLKELEAFPWLQKKLFSVAFKLLKPGGTLVYSTCSLSLEENEMIISWALQKFPELELQKQIPKLGGPGKYVCGLTPANQEKLQRFDINNPGKDEDADTIGFFIAKLGKSLHTVD